MRLSSWRWLGPVPAALLLQAVYGLLFADGVFVSIVHDPALTKAMGLSALFTALGITAFGILLHNASDPSVYRAAPRLLALLGAAAVCAQVPMAYALRHGMLVLLYVSASLLGAGCGSVYVVSIIVLQDWVPEAPGLVTGVALLLGGVGTLFGIHAFQAATQALGGPVPAMALAGWISAALCGLAALLMKRPPTGWSPMAETPADELPYFHQPKQSQETQRKDFVVDDDREHSFTAIPLASGETQPLLPHKQNDPRLDTRLSIYEMLVDPAFFFMFISVSAAVGPGFGFAIAFPRMLNTLFGLELAPANQMLFWVTLVGVVGRVLIGLVIDLLQSPAGTPEYDFLGAKRMNTALLALQSMALAAMPFCIRLAWTNVFTLATATVYITFNGGAVVSACLARRIFSPENSTLAFALLGIGMGVGRSLFSLAVAACQGEGAQLAESMASRRVYEYDLYVHSAFLTSAIGLVFSYYVSPSKTAYQNGSNSPVYADLRV